MGPIVGVVTSSPPEPDLTQLRVALARARADAGWTFEQLSEQSGVSRQTLLNLSSGKHAGDLKTWLKLSRAFDVSLDDLLAPVWD
jgi:putative transcriptional regulator